MRSHADSKNTGALRTSLRPSSWLAVSVSMFVLAPDHGAHANIVKIRPIVRLAVGGSDTMSMLPATESAVALSSNFYVEVWVQTSDVNGLSSVSLDLTFDPSMVTATGITHTALFSDLTSGAIDNVGGRTDDLSGSHLGPCSDAVGVAPNWARLAIIEMSADSEGVLQLQAAPTATPALGTAICGVGDLDPSEVSFEQQALFVGDVDVPAVSQWGAAILGIALMTVATLVLGNAKRRHGIDSGQSGHSVPPF